MLVVPVLILDKSWWWFFGTLLGEIVAGLVVGSIILLLKLRKKAPEKIKVNIKEAKQRAINLQKYDTDNPDNFKILQSRMLRIGEKGADKTPILHLDGIGTERLEHRVVIINLNDSKEEPTLLINPTEFQVQEAINKIAEHPPEEEIREEITRGVDIRTGMPLTTIKTRRPSQAEKRMEEEKKQAEETGAI